VPKELEIAVVDDDQSFRLSLVESLCSLGYAADGYPSAEDYIGAIADKSFDCVVTDIHMRGMSGLELMQWLAARGLTTPVVLVTANADIGLEARATTAGAVCLLIKPFEISDLIKCIERAAKN
jgi:FixJ family two-component response regulator